MIYNGANPSFKTSNMKYILNNKFTAIFFVFILLLSCKKDKKWQGQGEISKVSTETVPVQRQYKGTFDLGNGIYASNDFDGARLNGISLTNDTLITALITPENAPINTSPWYGFKIWSDTGRKVTLKMTYPEGVKHRYFPKISMNGVEWASMDSTQFDLNEKINSKQEITTNAKMQLSIGPDTLWISAQELITDSQVEIWSDELSKKTFIKKSKIGESREGRDINVLKIGKNDDKAIVVVLSRQHPPEVTGYLAMQAFVETLSSENEKAAAFRNKYNTYVIPLANPDGVNNGHWRHGMGGIDLNRDWEDFNQPETSAIRDFIKKKIADSGGKIYFFVDFHSTWEDIYYTIDPKQKGNMPGLVPDLIAATGEEFENYEPNIRPSPGTGKRVTSTSHFFYQYDAESLTYEIGDNTPRDFVRKKGEVTANKLMELMVK